MPYVQKDNNGVLFKNDRKEKPNQPDYTGNAMVNGAEVRLSAWLKEGQRGKYLSLAFSPKDAAQSQERPQPTGARTVRQDMDDEIPF